MAYKKISELCMALPLVNSDLLLVSQTDVNSTNKISRQLPVRQLWSEISSRFVTYDYDGAEKATLSSDRHHSFAYALSSDVSSKTQVEDRFNTLSVYVEISNQLSNDGYVLSSQVHTRNEASVIFALSSNVYSAQYVSANYALSADVYNMQQVYTKNQSDQNYYRKNQVYTKDETYSKYQADDKFTLRPATQDTLGGIKVGTGLNIMSDGRLAVTDASKTRLGGVKVGNGLDIAPNGELSVLPANGTQLGGITVRDNAGLSVSTAGQLALTPASATRLGGIKVGDGLNVDQDGIVSVVTSTLETFLEKVYPIGCVYLTLDSRNPHDIFGFGLWQRIAVGKCLWGAKADNSDLGKTKEAGLPDINGSFSADNTMIGTSYEGSSSPPTGAFTGQYIGGFDIHSTASGTGGRLNFNASSSNPIYGNSDTVQPPALAVNIWKRVSQIDPETKPYYYSKQAKSDSWTVQYELKNVTISISLPRECGGGGGNFYINRNKVATVTPNNTVTVKLESVSKDSLFNFTSGCSNHNLTVTVSGTAIVS